jgi:hypothetical protein
VMVSQVIELFERSLPRIILVTTKTHHDVHEFGKNAVELSFCRDEVGSVDYLALSVISKFDILSCFCILGRKRNDVGGDQ